MKVVYGRTYPNIEDASRERLQTACVSGLDYISIDPEEGINSDSSEYAFSA